MRAFELIKRIRSRLNDEAKEGWSDEELLDSVNSALYAIAYKLMPWKGRWSSATVVGEDTYSIPEDFLAPISLIYNGEIIPIIGVEWALRQSENMLCAFIDNDALILSIKPDSIVPFSLNYHAIYYAETTGDILKIPAEMGDAVLFYAMSLALHKPANDDSIAQSRYFLKLYEDRCRDISKISQMRRGVVSITSRFQKV